MIATAYLRVYQARERAGRWRRHPDRPSAAVVRADDRFVWQEPTTNDAFTVEWDGRTFVCPRFPRLRMLEGVIAFKRTHPAATLVSETTAENAADELARIRSHVPRARSHILTSPWHVPLRWFAAFDPPRRELYDASHGLSIRYRSHVGEGADRIRRAEHVLEEAGFDDSVVDQVRDLGRWLAAFERDGMLELDYARVARLFTDADLVMDESAVEVNASLEALSASDFEKAGLEYASVATRWASAQSLTYVN